MSMPAEALFEDLPAAEETAPVESNKSDGPRLGVFSDISNEDYHRGPGISKSGLDLIDQSPRHYIEVKKHPKPTTKAMTIGSALHCLVLEPDEFDKLYVRDPNPGSQSAKAKEARLQLAEDGLTVISTKPGESTHWSPGDWDTIHRMRDAVMTHPFASVLLDPDQGEAEQSVYWIDEETGKLCKCRPDFFNDAHKLMVDLKSTDDASYTGFGKSVAKWRYHVQHPFYVDGWRAAGRRVRSFVFVAVEKQPPYGVGVYQLDPKVVHIGRSMYLKNLHTYAKYHGKDFDEWPSYPPEIRDLEIPSWGLQGHIN